jgi:DNA-binding NarL/FixJ family response regulator
MTPITIGSTAPVPEDRALDVDPSLYGRGHDGPEPEGEVLGLHRRPAPAGPLRAVIADDDPLARRAVSEALQRAGIVVVAEAHHGRQAVEFALQYEPDIVIMDVIMPHLDGIAATRRIVEQCPGQVVIMLTRSTDDELGLLGLHAGAAGHLTKDIDLDALPRAVESALAGQAAISRSMGMRLIEHLRRPRQGRFGLSPVGGPLTAQEWELVDLLCHDLPTEEIAKQLQLSPETARARVKSLLRKLGVRSRREAVLAAGPARRLRG